MALRTAWLLVAALLALTGELHADEPPSDAIALLPLDADQQLELYGQPVASEIARSLVAGGIDVVVVGPKMAVPERARLIVDGKIAAPPKSDTVTLTVRVRSAADGLVLETLESKAAGLANIDRAAAELSARVLVVVRTQLAAQVKKLDAPKPAPPPLPVRTVAPAPKPWEIAAKGDPRLVAAFATETPAWTRTVPGTKIELAVKRFAIESGTIPLARARVHIRTYDGAQKTFDRVVVTDTVVGDRAMAPDALAARVAREVLSIARPHVRRGVR